MEESKKKQLTQILLPLIIFVVAFVPRVYELESTSLSVDEVEKLAAVHEYSDYNFNVDMEHPPILKLLLLGSVELFGEQCNGAFFSPDSQLVFLILQLYYRKEAIHKTFRAKKLTK